MKKGKLVFLLLISVILGYSVTSISYNLYNHYEVRYVPMQVEVGDKLGMNIESDYLDFGVNFPGNTLAKYMEVSYPQKTNVIIAFDGPIAEWINVDKNDFVLESGEIQELKFLITLPEDLENGIYDGTVIFYFNRP